MGHGVLSIATEKGHIQVVLKNSQPSDGERPAQMERSWAQMERGWAQMERDCTQMERSWNKQREAVHKWRGAGTNRERLAQMDVKCIEQVDHTETKMDSLGEGGWKLLQMVLRGIEGR